MGGRRIRCSPDSSAYDNCVRACMPSILPPARSGIGFLRPSVALVQRRSQPHEIHRTPWLDGRPSIHSDGLVDRRETLEGASIAGVVDRLA